MKKHDLYIISIASVIVLILVVVYMLFSTSSTDYIQICYKNDVIYELKYSKEANYTIYIEGKSNKINIDGDITQDITYFFNENFYNTIQISDGKITMIDASCENHTCMNMVLNDVLKTPIICTSGVLVRFSSEEIKIYV